MTEPSEEQPSDGQQLRLLLDEGEILELQPPTDEAHAPEVVLRLPAARAYDLSRVLDSYTDLVQLGAQAGEVSGTEASLARGLRDASVAAGRGRSSVAPDIDERARLHAMAELQAARPDLSHSCLIAVVDSAAAWLAQRADHQAIALLDAVAGDGAGSQAYLTLVGYDRLPARTGLS